MRRWREALQKASRRAVSPRSGGGAPAPDEEERIAFVNAPAEEVGEPPPDPVEPRVIERVSQPRLVAARASGERHWPATTRWAVWIMAAVLVGVLLVVWSAVQATQQEEAERILMRALVPLTEVDVFLEAEYDSILESATNSRSGIVTFPRYPLPITLPAAEVAAMSAPELRTRLLRESAALISEDGIDAFRRAPTGSSGGVFTAGGAIRWTVGRLTADTHDVTWLVLAAVLVFAIPGMILVLASSAPRDRMRNVGGVLLASGLLVVVATLSARYALRVTANGAADPLHEALLDIGADTLSIVLRNAIIVLVLGAAFIGLGGLVQWWERRTLSGLAGRADLGP